MPRVIRHKWEEFAELGLETYRADRPGIIAIDTETTGVTWKDTPFGLSAAWHHYPEGTLHDPALRSFWFELEEQNPCDLARVLIQEHHDRGGTFRFFNAKFDIIKLINYGLWDPYTHYKIEDVAPMAALLEPSGERGLKPVSEKYLGRSVNNAALVRQATKELGLKLKDGFWALPREVIVPYALDDAEMTLDLGAELRPLIRKAGLDYAYERESLLGRELIDMERAGLAVDVDAVREAIKVCDQRMEMARAKIAEIVGMEVTDTKLYQLVDTGEKFKNGNIKWKRELIPTFNPNSNPQVIGFFHNVGIHIDNTQEETLSKVDHPLVEQLISLSKEQKLRNTYLVKLLEQADENGVVHPNLNPGGTATGRFSSGGAVGNWQNLPAHDERSDRLKSCIKPKLDAFLCVDYEAMEFRVAAYYLKAQPTIADSAFADEILSGGDPHHTTAQLIEGREEVTKQERDKAKRTMFSMLYSGSGKTIWKQGLTDTLEEGYAFAERFHQARPQIKMLERSVMRAAKKRRAEEGHAYVKTVWGRKLTGDEHYPLTRWVWSPAAGEKVEILGRPLVNYLIQGSSSDVMKDAIIRVGQFLRDGLFQSHLVLTIHDELILDCVAEEIPAIVATLPGLMGNAQIETVLPLSVDIEIASPTWADQKPYVVLTEDTEPGVAVDGAVPGSPYLDHIPLPWED